MCVVAECLLKGVNDRRIDHTAFDFQGSATSSRYWRSPRRCARSFIRGRHARGHPADFTEPIHIAIKKLIDGFGPRDDFFGTIHIGLHRRIGGLQLGNLPIESLEPAVDTKGQQQARPRWEPRSTEHGDRGLAFRHNAARGLRKSINRSASESPVTSKPTRGASLPTCSGSDPWNRHRQD